MDFDRYLLQIQRCMISTHNTLQSHCDTRTEADKSRILSDKIKTTIEKWPEDYDFRKVCLYLICNCDLQSLNSLTEDETVGHIIGTAHPCLSKYLVFHAILKLEHVCFLQDLITFGPHLLSADLLETFLAIANSDFPIMTVNVCTHLSKACFHKLILCKNEEFSIQYKFFMYFKQLISIMLGIKVDIKSSTKDLYSLAGKVAESLLELCAFCVKGDLSNKTECWECYCLHCDSNFDEWVASSSEVFTNDQLIWQCRDLIFSSCVKNLSAVSVDVWLSWVEIDVTPSMTLQQCVGEAAYHCDENLKTFKNFEGKFESFQDLKTILSQMKIKPWHEEDEVKESSLSVIVENLADENRNKKLWLKGLLQHEEVLETAESISAVEKNSALIDEEDAVFMLGKIVSKLRLPVEHDSSSSSLMSLSFKLLEHFSLASHMRVIERHLSSCGCAEDICFNTLPLTLISVFNKMIDSNDDEYQLTCEAIRLCIFNSKAVVEGALSFGLEGHRQSTMMTKFLVILRPISLNVVKEWVKKFKNTCTIEVSQMDTFPMFVSELVEEGVVNAEFLIKESAMPALFEAFNCKQFNIVVMWIVTLELILKKEDIAVSKDFRWGPLVAFIGQLLGRCLQSIPTFDIHYLEVREAALSLLQALTKIELDDMEQRWLSAQIDYYPAIVNCYFNTFIKKPDVDAPDIIEDNQYCALKYCFPKAFPRIETAACVLVEILPSLTMNEWKFLAEHFMEVVLTKDDNIWSAFQVYRQSMLLIASASSSSDATPLSDQHICCLNYCVRSFGLVLKDKILPSLNDSYHLTVLTETLQILSRCPPLVWNRGAIFLSSILFDLIRSIPHTAAVVNQLRAIFGKCPESDTRLLIERKLDEVLADCPDQL